MAVNSWLRALCFGSTTFAGVLAVLAPTVGPIVGGWITETYSWHWLFLINVLPGIFSAVFAGVLLPKEPMRLREVCTLDVPSLTLLAIALAALEIAFKEAPMRGWNSGFVLGLLALSFASSVGFIRRTLNAPRPIVSLNTFVDRNFTIGCVLSFVLGIGLFGSVYRSSAAMTIRSLWAAFSPDGGRVVTASADTTARVWDAATGKAIVVLSGHDGERRGFELMAIAAWRLESKELADEYQGFLAPLHSVTSTP